MDGLVCGRIVYFVFDEQSAAEVMRRRTTGSSIAERMRSDVPQWPAGAQAHIGNDVHAGDICPAMVVATDGSGRANLKVMLDGSDTFWATSVAYEEWTPEAENLPTPRTWHWMFSGQSGRYTPAAPATSPV